MNQKPGQRERSEESNFDTEARGVNIQVRMATREGGNLFFRGEDEHRLLLLTLRLLLLQLLLVTLLYPLRGVVVAETASRCQSNGSQK